MSKLSLPHLIRAREFLGEHYDSPVTLAHVAKEIGYSPFHLQREFAEAFGESPQAFLQRMRLARARRLIVGGSLTVSEACVEVGYQSLPSFSRLFAREFGRSPTELRRVFAIPTLARPIFIPSCFLIR